jgi:hypothetical protein
MKQMYRKAAVQPNNKQKREREKERKRERQNAILRG